MFFPNVGCFMIIKYMHVIGVPTSITMISLVWVSVDPDSEPRVEIMDKLEINRYIGEIWS